MFCNNCGSKLEDGSLFCSSCGEKCEDNSMQPSAQNSNPHIGANNLSGSNYAQDQSVGANYPTGNAAIPQSVVQVAGVNEDEQSSTTVDNEQFGDYIPEFIPPKKNKKFLKIFIPVIAAVLIITSAVLVFGRTIFYAVAPEKYVAGLIKATTDDLSSEWTQVEKNVFGFDVSMNEDMTSGISLDFKEGENEGKVEFNVANDPKDEQLLFEGSLKNLNGNDTKLNAYGYLDNENMGVMLPGSDGKYLSLPSKDFGKKITNSNNYMGKTLSKELKEESKDGYDLFRSLDLSYDTIKQLVSPDKKVVKNTSKHVAGNLIEFLKETDLGERKSTKYEFENKTVNAHEISLTVKPEDVLDMLINTCEDIDKDDKINKLVEVDKLAEELEDLKDELKKSEEDIPDFEVKLIEYKGRIVSVEISYETTDEDEYSSNSHEYTITISAVNREKLLNGIKLTTSTKTGYYYDDSDRSDHTSSSESEIIITSNWASKLKKNDDIITMNMDVSSKYKYNSGDESDTSKSGGEIELELDFEKEKWKLSIDPDDSSAGFSYSGKCSKENGFSFSIDEEWEDEYYTYETSNSMSYEEWLEEELECYEYSFMRYIYDTYYYYDSEYSSYYDWEDSSKYDLWYQPDSYFEEWLYNEHYSYYDSLRDAYDSETYEEEEVAHKTDAHIKLELTLKNEIDVKKESGKNDNLLKWSESDFEDFAEALRKEVEK